MGRARREIVLSPCYAMLAVTVLWLYVTASAAYRFREFLVTFPDQTPPLAYWLYLLIPPAGLAVVSGITIWLWWPSRRGNAREADGSSTKGPTPDP